MKIKIAIPILIIGSLVPLLAQSFETIDVYGGASSITITSTDFNNFHISDWERYGLGTHEGRVAVPLGDNDIAGQNFNFLIGASSPLISRVDLLGEAHVRLGDVSYNAFFLGANLNILNNDRFKFSFTPKLGYIMSTANFGNIEVLPSKMPPVILSEGTFYEGDTLSMDLTGLGAQIALTATLFINETIGITAQVGQGISFIEDPKIVVNSSIGGKTEIPMESPGVVKDDFSSTQAGLDPEASTNGLIFQFGLVYKMPI